MKILKSFYKDLIDKGAISNHANTKLPDIWGSIVLVMSAAVAFIDYFKKLALDNFGMPGIFLPNIFICIGMIWSIYAISAKVKGEKKSNILINSNQEESQIAYEKYVFNNYLRFLSKFSLLLFILILPYFIHKSIKETLPLPKMIYGYLYSSITSQPIFDARLRIKNSDGVDITKGDWFTDSNGFYFIESNTNPQRNFTIEVIIKGCTEGYSLLLTSSYEVNTEQNLKPIFTHYINTRNCSNEE